MTEGVYIAGKVAPEHAKIRANESLEAAKILEMECVFLNLAEGILQSDFDSQMLLSEQIRKYAPQIVITHPPRDYHSDHINTSRCTLEAVLMSWSPCVQTEHPPCPRPKLYYCDAWLVSFLPDEYVDITTSIDLKRDMLGCHKSQLAPCEPAEDNLLDMAVLQSRVRGVEAGVRYAEAFQLVPNLGSVRLRNLLGQ
jgi:LmbE family N-acetylglucosaminyl deacetylase